jgi:hypothetical protein
MAPYGEASLARSGEQLMRLITVSREYGARGGEVASRLSSILGWNGPGGRRADEYDRKEQAMFDRILGE